MLEVKAEGVMVVARPWASVLTTPTAEVAVVSVADMAAEAEDEAEDEGVTNRVDVLARVSVRVNHGGLERHTWYLEYWLMMQGEGCWNYRGQQ